MANDNEDMPAAEQQQKTQSRRRFLQGTLTLGAALASAGIYEIIDTIAHPPERVALADGQPWPPEQYIIENLSVIMDNGSGINSSNGTIPVVVHPLHDHMITAKLNVPATTKDLQEAQQHLESVLLGLEQKFDPTPGGLSIVIVWGLPYFHNYIPSLGQTSSFFQAGTRYPDYLPIDLATSKLEGHTVYAVQDAMTFPSDQPPAGFGPVRLEQNDVAVLLRSDSLANIMEGTNAIFGTASNQAGSLFNVTSIRRGFTGGGFYGQQSLASKLALEFNLPGAASIPTNAQIFMGFTSTIQSTLSPGIIANLETIPGQTNQWPNGYFKRGTTMHLSHMFEDLATWYGSGGPPNYSTYADRLQAMLRPGLSVPEGTLTVNPPIESKAQVFQDVQQYKVYGHTGSMQTITRQDSPTTSNYGTVYPTGTIVNQRGDFNTVDNPFYYTSDPTGDHYSSKQAAGMHFITFQPTIGNFNRTRLAMDGHYSDKTIDLSPRSFGAGINSVLFTTHRQNYLVPPRIHRSFPLAEFLA
ncbi:hypothetical protein ccbrp13_23730 [Ktedonobacteria bacterium brp13]|nr:hypothetical protein ccbrp13_23730 [Ktedonobacteria bacterium brp13]